jgi:hypothetical protein
MAAVCPVDIVFYGGTRGGGKSDTLIGRHIRGAERYGRHWNGLVGRRKYKDFSELRRRWDELIASGLPAERIGGDQQQNVVRFRNGATVTMTSFENLGSADDHQGHQYTEISIDEAPSIPFIAQLIDKLKGCLRSPHGVPCRMFLTGNPGGSGAAAIKAMFIDAAPAGTIMRDASGMTRVFISSTLEDNQILCRNDPRYVQTLRSIQDKALRAAWLEGRWDVFVGQAFDFFPQTHVIDPAPVPFGVPIYSTFDWGFGKPFSWGWWWVDNDGRVYRFAEWYGWNGTPDTGMRLSDSEIAAGVLEREDRLNIAGRPIIRLAGPDCFAKKPDFRGGGQGPSTAEVFGQHGVHLSPGDPSRSLKIRQFRERLTVRGGDAPMLLVYSTCKHFIRTIPALCLDDANPEDIDTDQEDHIYDEACHVCMARPITGVVKTVPVSLPERLVRYVTGKTQDLPTDRPGASDGSYVPDFVPPVPSGRKDASYVSFDA